jgi:hypothetical protein
MLPVLAALAILPALSGCLTTPPTSSWATDVYKIRLGTLKPGMTTAQILDIMCPQGPMRTEGDATIYDLTEGYDIALFFNGDRNHPKEVVLHTPYATYPANWTKLEPSELNEGDITTRPAH